MVTLNKFLPCSREGERRIKYLELSILVPPLLNQFLHFWLTTVRGKL